MRPEGVNKCPNTMTDDDDDDDHDDKQHNRFFAHITNMIYKTHTSIYYIMCVRARACNVRYRKDIEGGSVMYGRRNDA